MKNLIAWLKKHGYLYEIKTATENYFYNVPELSQEAATIEINTPDINELRRMQKQLETHLNRYNYRIFIDARLQQHYDGTYHKYYYVTSQKNAAILEHYRIYADAARTECELLIHEYHEAGKHETHAAELNAALKIIMDKHGAMYNRSFIKIIAA